MIWMLMNMRVSNITLKTLCDKVWEWISAGLWFSPVSSTNKTGRHDITEILLKVALNTINHIDTNEGNGTALLLLFYISLTVGSLTMSITYTLKWVYVLSFVFACQIVNFAHYWLPSLFPCTTSLYTVKYWTGLCSNYKLENWEFIKRFCLLAAK